MNIVKNLNAENAELMDRVNELNVKVEQLETSNKKLNDRLAKYETIEKADIASIRTVIELMRKELEVRLSLWLVALMLPPPPTPPNPNALQCH